MIRKSLLLAFAALALLACEGTSTGEKAESIAVDINAQGGYGPIKVNLTQAMSPVALNLRAEHGIDASQAGEWNAYRITLTRAGALVDSADFSINYTGTADGQMGVAYQVKTMLIVPIGDAGDYDLVVTPTKPNTVKITSAKVEIRRNVQMPPPGRKN